MPLTIIIGAQWGDEGKGHITDRLAQGAAGAFLISSLSDTLDATVAWNSVALAIFFSAAVGLFFGIYPATRAARLNPIDALRYE